MHGHTVTEPGIRCAHVKAINEIDPVTVATSVETMKVVTPKMSRATPAAASTPQAARPRSPAMHTAKHSKVLTVHMHEATAVMMACIPTLMRHRNVMSQDHEHEDVLSSRSNIEQQTICVLATDLGEAISAPHNVIA